MTTYLALALSTKGFGETILGLQVAQQLRNAGNEVFFLSHPSAASMIQASGFSVNTISDGSGFLLPLYLTELVRGRNADVILLADYFTTDLWLAQNRLDADVLTELGLPIVAIDTWHMSRSGTVIDIYWRKTRLVRDWRDRVSRMIEPVPIASNTCSGGYNCLPSELMPLPRGRIQTTRDSLGLSDSDRLVLFCTAHWQQTKYSCEHAQRLSATLPKLLAGYISSQGAKVHLLHIGPHAYELELGDRYVWLNQLPQDKFKEYLGAADLLLTANISSTTIGRAILMDVPVLVLVNSYELETADDIDALRSEMLTPRVKAWAYSNTPLFRFLMWPVGYFDFLGPLRPGNTYFEAVLTEEVLNEPGVNEALSGMLWSSQFRRRRIQAQRNYSALISVLPGPLRAVSEVML